MARRINPNAKWEIKGIKTRGYINMFSYYRQLF